MQNEEKEYSFKSFFVPLTTLKAIRTIIIIGFLVYFNSLFGSFLGDDKIQLQSNYVIQSLSNLPKFFLGHFAPIADGTIGLVGPFYRPLFFSTYSFIYFFFGENPFFFHVVQLSLHIVNTILVFILLSKFFRKNLAFFLSLIFLIHPINTEAVVYIAELQEQLFFLFGISALILTLHKNISVKRLVLISFLLLCALLSKETGILFCMAIVLHATIFKKNKLDIIKKVLIVFIPLLMYAYLRFAIAKVPIEKIPDIPLMNLSFLQRLLTTPAIMLFYLKTFFYPSLLNFFQRWYVMKTTFTNFYFPLFLDSLFLFGFIIFGVFIYRKQKIFFLPYLFFTLWFLLGIGFYLQLIPLDFTVADRWFYFSMIGLLGMMGIFYQSFLAKRTRNQQQILAMGIVILCILSLRTVVRNTNWSDEITLYSHDLQYSSSYILENNLGLDYELVQNDKEALVHFNKSVQLHPVFGNLYDLANVYRHMGNVNNAEEYYLRALQTDKKSKDYKLFSEKLYQELTTMYIKSHKYADAQKIASEALLQYPHDGLLWENVAVSNYLLGNQDSALFSIKQALLYVQNNEVQYVYQQINTNKPLQIGE